MSRPIELLSVLAAMNVGASCTQVTCPTVGCGLNAPALQVLDSSGQPVARYWGRSGDAGQYSTLLLSCDTNNPCTLGPMDARMGRPTSIPIAIRSTDTGEEFCGDVSLSWEDVFRYGPQCGSCAKVTAAPVHLGAPGSCGGALDPVECHDCEQFPALCSNCTRPLRIRAVDSSDTLVPPSMLSGTLTINGEHLVVACDQGGAYCSGDDLLWYYLADPGASYSIALDAGDKGTFSGSFQPGFTPDLSVWPGCTFCGEGTARIRLDPPSPGTH